MKRKPTKLTFDVHLTEHAQMSLSIAMAESELAAGSVVENALDLYVEMVRQQQKICYDCELFCGRERYWLRNSVWQEAAVGHGGDLCIGCLEIRLGRTTTARDFDADNPKNFTREMVDSTQRLKRRMSGLYPGERVRAAMNEIGGNLLEVPASATSRDL